MVSPEVAGWLRVEWSTFVPVDAEFIELWCFRSA